MTALTSAMGLVTILRFLTERRVARFKVALLLPALCSLVLLCNPFEDAHLSDDVPGGVVLVLIVLYSIRPMYLVWLLLFSGFAAMTALQAIETTFGLSAFARLSFVAVWALPTLALYAVRPRRSTRPNGVCGGRAGEV